MKTYVLARQEMFDLKAKNFFEGSELPSSCWSPTVSECPIPCNLCGAATSR